VCGVNDPVQSAPASYFKNIWEFVRSVLPVDWGQTALLFGAVLLLAVPHMGMWNTWLLRLHRVEGPDAFGFASVALLLPLYLLYIGGAVALWVALHEVQDATNWIRPRVSLLVAAGLTIELALGWHFQNRYSHVPLTLGSNIQHGQIFGEIAARWPGFTFEVATFALFLLLAADGRLLELKMNVPVQFPVMKGDVPGAAAGTAKLIWSMLVLTSLMTMVVSACSTFISLETGIGLTEHGSRWLITADWQVLWAIGLATILWFSCGDERLALFSRSLRFPELKWAALGVLFPLAVTSAVPLGGFYLYRVRGPAAYPADYPAEFSHHFPAFVWSNLIFLIPALAEEIAWRGYLQPKFIRRFGMYRGIFLVGIVWGAFHFPWDFTGRTETLLFAVAVAQRLVTGIAVGFVLSWLTLRARSVVPAAIAHGVMNALYFSDWSGDTSYWVILGLWGALAFVLFRFYPPETDADAESDTRPNDELRDGGGVMESPA
jgi:membrane protease YdiL (CAAX protease family)